MEQFLDHACEFMKQRYSAMPLVYRIGCGVSVVIASCMCIFAVVCKDEHEDTSSVVLTIFLARRLEDDAKVHGNKKHEISYSVAADLVTQMPFYLTIISFYVKSTITVLAAGVERTDKPKSCLSTGILIANYVCLVVATISDFHEAKRMIHQKGFTMWEKFNGVVLVLATSSNVSTSAAFYGLFGLFSTTAEFNKAHDLPDAHVDAVAKKALPGTFLSAIPLLGAIWSLLVTLPILLYITPALIAYCWMSLAFVAFLYFTCHKIMPALVKYGFERKRAGGPELVSEAVTLNTDLPEASKWSKLESTEYEENVRFYKLTGAPKEAWYGYFLLPTFLGLFVPLFASLGVRLYTGRGYIKAITETLGERHITIWAKHLVDSAIDAAGSMENVTPNHIDSYVILAKRWLIAIGYWL